MSQVVRVSATDSRIVYFGWQLDRFQDGMWSFSWGSTFFFLFRGTGIKVYGTTQPLTEGGLLLTLDANKTDVVLNGTTLGSDVSPMYHADNMEDGDHHLSGLLSVKGERFEINYFEIENSSGGGFDLLSAGPTAQNVPTEAAIVDNTSQEIIYRNESVWKHDSGDISSYSRSTSYTLTVGSSLSYSFTGVAIWYYGAVGPGYGFFNVSIDGSTPQRLTAENNTDLYQRLIWSNTSLSPGRHNLTLTHDDTRSGSRFSLDFFRVLLDQVTSTQLSLPTEVQPIAPANQSQTNKVPLAVGLALGLLALVVGALGSVYYRYRRRRRTPVVLDPPSVSPYTVPPMTQTDPQSRLPQGGKRAPQLAPPPGAPVDTGDPPMSSHISQLGPPPSYDSPMHGWRMGVHDDPTI